MQRTFAICKVDKKKEQRINLSDESQDLGKLHVKKGHQLLKSYSWGCTSNYFTFSPIESAPSLNAGSPAKLIESHSKLYFRIWRACCLDRERICTRKGDNEIVGDTWLRELQLRTCMTCTLCLVVNISLVYIFWVPYIWYTITNCDHAFSGLYLFQKCGSRSLGESKVALIFPISPLVGRTWWVADG